VDQEHRQVVHNTYLQMLTDSGVFAFAIYVVLLWGTTWWLGRSAKRMREFDPKLAAVPLALRASLVAFAIGSTFLSRVQFDLTYFVLMAAAAWMPIEHQRLLEIAEQLEDEEDEADLPDSEADPAAA
jgi:O-antigen ligase